MDEVDVPDGSASLSPYLWILTSAFMFSWMATFSQLAGQGVPWPMTAMVRAAVPLVVMAVWARSSGVPLILFGPPILWLRSLAGSCSLVCTFYAISNFPLTEVFTIANTFPVWVAMLSWPMLGKSPGWPVWLSVLSSIFGVALIMQPRLNLGDYSLMIAVAISMFTALAMMGLHQLKHLDPRAVVVHFSATALLFSTGAAALFAQNVLPETFTVKHAILLLAAGLSATVGQLFLTKAFTYGDPAKVAVVNLTQILFVLTLDVTVLGHELDASKLWGVPFVVVPSAWLMYHSRKKPVDAIHATEV